MEKINDNYCYNEREYGWIVSVDSGKEKFYPTKIEVIDNCVYDILDGCSYIEITAPSDKEYCIDLEYDGDMWNGLSGKSIRANISNLLRNEEN